MFVREREREREKEKERERDYACIYTQKYRNAAICAALVDPNDAHATAYLKNKKIKKILKRCPRRPE